MPEDRCKGAYLQTAILTTLQSYNIILSQNVTAEKYVPLIVIFCNVLKLYCIVTAIV